MNIINILPKRRLKMDSKTQKITCLIIIFTLFLIMTHTPVESQELTYCQVQFCKWFAFYTACYGLEVGYDIAYRLYIQCLQIMN